MATKSPQEPQMARPMSIGGFINNGEAAEIVELDKSGVAQRKWVHKGGHDLVSVELHSTAGKVWRSFQSWREPLLEAFLPVGFPHSVSEDYLAYQTYDSLQAFFSTVSSMLANRALLEGLGVGDANTSATFALLLTVLKDAMSRLATIAFAQRFGLGIEPDCKRYRFLADLFNDSAFFLDLVSPVLSSVPKVAVLSVAEALRALCGVAAGASKAALSSHFALQDNLAELNAKEASQETAVGLVGLLAGTIVVKLIEDRATVFWLMVTLVFAHLGMNYAGVRCVALRTLNRQRATIVLQHWLEQGEILTPKEVSTRENIVFWSTVLTSLPGFHPAKVAFAKNYADSLSGPGSWIGVVDEPRFCLMVRTREPERMGQIKILVREGAEPVDMVRAWFLAMQAVVVGPEGTPSIIDKAFWKDAPKAKDGLFRISKVPTLDLGPLLEGLEEKGWDLGTASVETRAPVRVRVLPFNPEKKDQ